MSIDKNSKKLSTEEIVHGFQKLREEQRGIANKIHELEMDKNEHKLVTETLEGIEGSRRCFRLLGGVLVERTVREVLPALQKNEEQITKVLETLNEQLVAKGRELSDYREKFGIRIQGEAAPISKEAGDSSPKSVEKTSDAPSQSTSVLVAQHG